MFLNIRSQRCDVNVTSLHNIQDTSFLVLFPMRTGFLGSISSNTFVTTAEATVLYGWKNASSRGVLRRAQRLEQLGFIPVDLDTVCRNQSGVFVFCVSKVR